MQNSKTSLKIALDGRPLNGPTNGFTIYLHSIISILGAAGHDLTLISDAPLASDPLLSGCSFVVLPAQGRNQRYWWAQTKLLRHLRKSQYDVYFSGWNVALPLAYFGHTELLLGLLDLIPFRFPRTYLLRRPHLSLYRYVGPQLFAAWKAKRILTISEASRRDIKRIAPWKSVSVSLVKLDTTNATTPPAKRKRQFVYVGGVDARKRIENIIRALAEFNRSAAEPYQLILIGRGYEVFKPLIDELGLADQVTLTGYLSENAKMQTIAESTAMVYASLYEGYGLAIAEGYLNATPVICGRGGSQEEVAGDGAIYIDPERSESITAAMREVLKPEVRARLEAGRKRQLKALTDPAIDQQVLRFFTQGKRL